LICFLASIKSFNPVEEVDSYSTQNLTFARADFNPQDVVFARQKPQNGKEKNCLMETY
jgi:hypothetical protein